jgi:hypothetical protein
MVGRRLCVSGPVCSSLLVGGGGVGGGGEWHRKKVQIGDMSWFLHKQATHTGTLGSYFSFSLVKYALLGFSSPPSFFFISSSLSYLKYL